MNRPEWITGNDGIDRIRGSDGISRSIDEWEDFIWNDRTNLAPNDSDLSQALDKVCGKLDLCVLDADELSKDTPLLNHDHVIQQLASAISEYAIHAIEDSLSKKPRAVSRRTLFVNHLEKLATACESKRKRNSQRFLLGLELWAYIRRYGTLPLSVKELSSAIEKRGKFTIPERTIRLHLKHYKLENIVRKTLPKSK